LGDPSPKFHVYVAPATVASGAKVIVEGVQPVTGFWLVIENDATGTPYTVMVSRAVSAQLTVPPDVLAINVTRYCRVGKLPGLVNV
jgi:hypothetical protein